MEMKLMEPIETFSGIRAGIYQEMGDLADYIWKIPRFLEAEEQLEKDKLWQYYPKQSDPEKEKEAHFWRLLRAAHEFPKIDIKFPNYLGTSSLFLATSIYESFLYDICQEIEHRTGEQGYAGGITRMMQFLKAQGMNPTANQYYEQVDAAVALRNCLFHADGRLALSREATKIRHIAAKRTFIDKERRKKVYDGDHEEVRIDPHSDRVRVNNYFAFRACGYYKRFLLGLTEAWEVSAV